MTYAITMQPSPINEITVPLIRTAVAHLAAGAAKPPIKPKPTPTKTTTAKPTRARKPRIDGQDVYGLASVLPPRIEPTPPPGPMTLADLDKALSLSERT